MRLNWKITKYIFIMYRYSHYIILYIIICWTTNDHSLRSIDDLINLQRETRIIHIIIILYCGAYVIIVCVSSIPHFRNVGDKTMFKSSSVKHGN